MVNFNVPPLESILEIKNHLYDLRLPSPLLVLSYIAGNVQVVLPSNILQAERDAKRITHYMHQSERHEREKSKGYHPLQFPDAYTENLIPFFQFFLRHSRRFNNISVLPQSVYDHVRHRTFIFRPPSRALLIAVCVGHTLSLFFDKRDDGNWIASHRESWERSESCSSFVANCPLLLLNCCHWQPQMAIKKRL